MLRSSLTRVPARASSRMRATVSPESFARRRFHDRGRADAGASPTAFALAPAGAAEGTALGRPDRTPAAGSAGVLAVRRGGRPWAALRAAVANRGADDVTGGLAGLVGAADLLHRARAAGDQVPRLLRTRATLDDGRRVPVGLPGCPPLRRPVQRPVGRGHLETGRRRL